MLPRNLKPIHLLAIVLIPAVLGLILVLVAGLYLFLLAPKEAASIPQVEVHDQLNGDQVTAEATVFLTARSSDPDGVERAELWVNGELISTQVNPDPINPSPFTSSHVWRALTPGFYSVSVRAYDLEGHPGQSETKVIEALASDPNAQDETVSAYFVQEGDSLGSIAERFETDGDRLTELNPGLSEIPQPGGTVYVPQPAETEDDDDADVPGISAAGAASPPAGAAHPAQPASAPPWAAIIGSQGPGSLFNVGNSSLCANFPALCNLPSQGQTPPRPPGAVSAQSNTSCQVDLQWTDNSEDEDGFQIIRINAANRDMQRTVARLEGNGSSGQNLSYQYKLGVAGEYLFYVEAYNAAGKAASPPTQRVQVECDQLPVDLVPLEIEMLELTVSQDVELLHCFVAVGNQPYVRVPADNRNMAVQNGAAAISDYLGAKDSVRLLVDPSQPLQIKLDCVEHRRPASQGGLLQTAPQAVDMGRYTASHPPAEWDGRELTGESSLDQFSILYRVQTQDSRVLSGTAFSGDLLAAPQITGRTDYWIECWMPLTCQHHAGSGFGWTWEPPADRSGDEEHIFYLWAKEHSQEDYSLLYQSERIPVDYWRRNNTGPWPTDEEICGRFPVTGFNPEGARYHTVTYYMQIEYFNEWGASELTPPSAKSGIAHTCEDDPVAYEVTLLDITAHEIQDFSWFAGTPEGEMYGSLHFGYEIHWNSHPIGIEPNLTVSPPPSTQSLIPGTYSWERMWLQIEDEDGLSDAIGNWSPSGEFALGNNVFYVPHFENTRENVFYFKDHDGGSSDDIWCVGFYPWAEGSPEDWLNTNETITIESAEGNCSITVHLRGVRVGRAEE